MSTFSGDIGPEEEDGAGWGGLVASKAEQRAEARQAALEKDAQRYRWLRQNPAWLGWTRDHQPEHVDAAVDQDMAAR